MQMSPGPLPPNWNEKKIVLQKPGNECKQEKELFFSLGPNKKKVEKILKKNVTRVEVATGNKMGRFRFGLGGGGRGLNKKL